MNAINHSILYRYVLIIEVRSMKELSKKYYMGCIQTQRLIVSDSDLKDYDMCCNNILATKVNDHVDVSSFILTVAGDSH